MKKVKFPRGVEVVGSAIIKNKKGEILLVKSEKWSNKWTLPGGHIEPGERIVDALIREAREEVGMRLRFIDIVHFGELISSKDFYRPAHFIFFRIYCKPTSKNVQLDGNELQDYCWVIPKKALRMQLAGSVREAIEAFIQYKKR